MVVAPSNQTDYNQILFSIIHTKRGAKSAARFHILRLGKGPTPSERATSKTPQRCVYQIAQAAKAQLK